MHLNKGFSLLEMVVVLVLLSVAMAVVAPSMMRLLGSTGLRSAVVTMCAAARQAHLIAVVQRRPVSLAWRDQALVLLRSDGHTLRRYEFPSGIWCCSPEAQASLNDVVFRPDGTADAARWRITQALEQGLVVAIDGPTATAWVESRP